MIQQRHLVKADTVGQSIGVIDRLGAIIFEGDIVNAIVYIPNGREEVAGKVFWNDFRYAFYLLSDNRTIYPINELFGMRVIGNIHDKEESE